MCPSVPLACGGLVSGSGLLRSPYHPGVYPHNKDCEWVVTQPEGHVVTLDFLSFDVEGGSCSYDFVQVATPWGISQQPLGYSWLYITQADRQVKE